MIIFMAGYPGSGKTEFATLLTKKLPSYKTIHIDPAGLRPPEYSTMTPEEQTRARIASWEVAQDMLKESLKESNQAIIIFDTCAAKVNSMLPLFNEAKVNKHDVIYAFVGATIAECKMRSKTNWPSDSVINGYGKEFIESIPKLKAASSRFFFIKNNNDPNRLILKEAVDKIAKVIINGEIDKAKGKPPLKIAPKPKPTKSPIKIKR